MAAYGIVGRSRSVWPYSETQPFQTDIPPTIGRSRTPPPRRRLRDPVEGRWILDVAPPGPRAEIEGSRGQPGRSRKFGRSWKVSIPTCLRGHEGRDDFQVSIYIPSLIKLQNKNVSLPIANHIRNLFIGLETHRYTFPPKPIGWGSENTESSIFEPNVQTEPARLEGGRPYTRDPTNRRKPDFM